eukprot:GFUD01031066.1.p1 GENE.GFUD01031066.1~~GFUD01031066.1.p1  ORF type:complete len:483 (+),score=100.87 GFUD01031066.1:230-1678(+)
MPHSSSSNMSNGDSRHSWPSDVGILAMDIYFPHQYVDQAELEAFDEVSAGKYTVGLGQTKMGFCSDREDVNSLCLTVVQRLLEKADVKYTQIGRMEVGTETIIDKSKSVKSVLMKLFMESGNTDMEGVDSTNACYGGTAALFNSVNWVESSAWDGRLALAVCADIAVYAAGAARPSGGAGAVAMLIGPHAPLVLDRGVRATHMQHVYDFYKPDMSSEYPVVDAKLSIQCYLSALDKCYAKYKIKSDSKGLGPVTLNSFDGVLFHTPYCKLVQKSLARLALNDYLDIPQESKAVKYPELEKLKDTKLEESYFDRDVEKAFMAHSLGMFESKTKPGLKIATNVGNMYTPSLYGGLVSKMISEPIEKLAGQQIALFSYGSGMASSFFSLRISNKYDESSALFKFSQVLADVQERLDTRQKVAPEDFVKTLSLREKAIDSAPFVPVGSVSGMFPGTWYLTSTDDMHRRLYDRVPMGPPALYTNGHV